MAKVTINESTLRQIIRETLEEMTDEGFLGIDWSSVPGTPAYKKYQAKMAAKDKAAHDDLETYKGQQNAALQRRFAQDDANLKQSRDIRAKSDDILSRERQNRYNSTYNDPLGGRTGQAERDYYGDTYGQVRGKTNNNDWQYGRR